MMPIQQSTGEPDLAFETREQTQVVTTQWLFLAVAAAPLIALLILLGLGVLQQRENSRLTGVDLQTLKFTSQQTETIPQWIQRLDQRRDNSPVVEWQIIVLAAQGLEETGYGDSYYPRAARLGERPGNEALMQLASNATPLVEAVRQATRDEQPIWRPVVFAGIYPWIDNIEGTRTVANCVNDAAKGALLAGRFDEAIDRWELLPAIADTIDPGSLVGGYMLYTLIRAEQLVSIRAALNETDWSPEQLSRMRTTVESHASSSAGQRLWRAMESSQAVLEEALTLQTRDHSFVHDLDAPFLSQIVRLTNPSLRRQNIFPDDAVFDRSFVMNSAQKRWTLCAIAIKQFRQQEHRWPESLEELSLVGLSDSEWATVKDNSLAYDVSEDQSVVTLRLSGPNFHEPRRSADDDERIPLLWEIELR